MRNLLNAFALFVAFSAPCLAGIDVPYETPQDVVCNTDDWCAFINSIKIRKVDGIGGSAMVWYDWQKNTSCGVLQLPQCFVPAALPGQSHTGSFKMRAPLVDPTHSTIPITTGQIMASTFGANPENSVSANNAAIQLAINSVPKGGILVIGNGVSWNYGSVTGIPEHLLIMDYSGYDMENHVSGASGFRMFSKASDPQHKDANGYYFSGDYHPFVVVNATNNGSPISGYSFASYIWMAKDTYMWDATAFISDSDDPTHTTWQLNRQYGTPIVAMELFDTYARHGEMSINAHAVPGIPLTFKSKVDAAADFQFYSTVGKDATISIGPDGSSSRWKFTDDETNNLLSISNAASSAYGWSIARSDGTLLPLVADTQTIGSSSSRLATVYSKTVNLNSVLLNQDAAIIAISSQTSGKIHIRSILSPKSNGDYGLNVTEDNGTLAPFQAKLTTDTAYAEGAPTATGKLIIYDSTGTAYEIPAKPH